MEKMSNTHSEQLRSDSVSAAFLLREFDQHFRFQMFKICAKL